MASDKEKMIQGQLYFLKDPQLTEELHRAHRICKLYNDTPDKETRHTILQELCGAAETAYIEPPFLCDYGYNIFLGKNVYFNVNCTILDQCPVIVGDDTMFGPAVQIYCARHPTNPEQRKTGIEYGQPITIGSNVWVGGGAIFNPGVTVGDNTVIGSGSVVTRSIPANVLAVGNPCRVIRDLTNEKPVS